MGMARLLSPNDPVAEATIALNIATIKQIPESELPDAAARAALVDLASAGVDVYAYVSAGSHQTTIWLRPFTSDVDGHMTCAEWQGMYQQKASDDALEDLVQQLADARRHYVDLAIAFFSHPNDRALQAHVRAADQRLREVEQRIRLIQWKLAGREHVA